MMSTNTDSRLLYFTSALSDRLKHENDGKASQGLYKCSLNTMNGSCQDPQLVADRFHHDTETRHGLRLSHLSIDNSSNDAMMYATYFENNSRGFEIVRGPLASKVQFQSFFRTKGVHSSHTCNKECCPGAHHTYLVTKPASYLVDVGEVFISWAGFYRNCASNDDDGFKWTIGISRLQDRPECTNTEERADFGDCTTPIQIASQVEEGQEEVFLNFSSFQSSRLPSGQRLFFLSVIRGNSDDPKAKPTNEIWAVQEGATESQLTHEIEIDDAFVADNLGSISLHLDENRVANAICLTAYDGGIFCDKLAIDQTGTVKVLNTITPITSQQIKEKCAIKPSEHYPLSKDIPAVASGLDVSWNADGTPNQLVFGCLGQLPNEGGFFTVFFDGRVSPVVEAMEGGYPGSLLFVRSPLAVSSTGTTQPVPTSLGNTQSRHEEPIISIEVGGEDVFDVTEDNAPVVFALAVVALLVAAALWVTRKPLRRWVGIVRRGSSFQSLHYDNSDYDFHAVSTNEHPPGGLVYMELTSTSTS
ncbi:unnamed protein product [Cylindrotheca closterium]|uniref:Uncharacterized protein n=1 Tax=Cylindrotheca closterium TaxID=2856 RepID=A0AAD2CC81_9STRA|nr:unnamed protein product [Cylindrotheca closterium]